MTHILIAEDEKDIRQLITLSLRINKMSSIAVEDGAQAVAQANATRFDAILLDMNMPELNGLEAGNLIRSGELNHATPILFLSGDPTLEAIPLPNSSLLTKPFTIAQLMTRIKSIL